MLKFASRRNLFFLLIFLIRATAFSQGGAGGTTLPTAEIPPGGFVTLKASALNASSYQWFKDNSPISGATAVIYKASLPGIYTVLAYSAINCGSILSDGVNLISPAVVQPQSDLQIVKKSETKKTGLNEPYEYLITVTNKGPQDASMVVVTDILPEGLTLKDMVMPALGIFDYNAPSRTITWKIDHLMLSATAELRFNVTAANPGLIKNTASVIAQESDPVLGNNKSTDEKEILGLKIPNVFTPNGDNVNDKFEIRGLELYASNEITIINRWGNIIYEKKNYNNDWDGNGLDEGTYFYILKVVSATGNGHTYKGYTTLLRAKTE